MQGNVFTNHWFTDVTIKISLLFSLHCYAMVQHFIDGENVYRDFDVAQAMVEPYDETEIQSIYFVAESLDNMRDKMM